MSMRSFAASMIVLLFFSCTAAPAVNQDVDIKATIYASYNVISGPPGRRDWDRFKGLFTPDGVIKDSSGHSWTPDEYAKAKKPQLDANAIFIWPVNVDIKFVSPGIAQATSRHELRHASSDEKPYATGVNEFRLTKSGDAWLIVSLTTDEL